MFLLFLFLNIFSNINIISPNRNELNSLYIKTTDLNEDTSCAKGITITWSTSVSSLNNQILVFSSSYNDTIPICYKYNGVYYGTTCGTCVSQANTEYPKYTNQTVSLYIPYRGIFSDYNSQTATSITFGVDCGLSGTTFCSLDTRLNNSTYDIYTSFTINVDNTAPYGYSKDYEVFRSNNSIFINNFDISNIQDSAGGSGLRYVRFYYGFCDQELLKQDDNFADFIYDSKQPWKLKGLENEVSYTLGVSILDKVANEYPSIEGGFLEDDEENEILPINIEDNSNCITPTQVLGFIDEDERCFIVSEVFGKKSKELSFYRSFRNKHLLSSKRGSFLVNKYYIYSPSLVKIIKKNIFFKFYFYYYLKLAYNIFND